MAKYDIGRLKDAVPLADLIGDVVDLKKNGSEWKGCCPFHGESTPSFTVFSGKKGDKYQCFGCDAKGDHLQFLQDYYNIDFAEAIEQLAERAGGVAMVANGDTQQRAAKRSEPAQVEWVQAVAPAGTPAPKELRCNRGEWVSMPVVAAWPYRNAQGELLSYTCRVEFEKDDGSIGKDVIPVCWKTNVHTGEQKWRQGALADPRPLYGVELLATKPKANVILVEGEKACDAARELFPQALVLTWAGGCKAVGKADWSVLAGRKIVGWPDCDSQRYADSDQFKPYHEQPGMAAMLAIAELVSKHGASMRIVEVPQPGDWPNGHDLYDLRAEGWTPEQTAAYLKENLREPAEIVALAAPAPEPEPANDNLPEPPPDYDYDEVDGPEPYVGEAPFRILGWDRGRAYYLPKGVPQVTALVPGAHTKLNLLQLAPLSYWQDEFPSDSKRSGDKTNWDMAANALIQQAMRAGIWDVDLVRGRGAWWDRGMWAVHLGDRVVMGDGEGHPAEYDLRSVPSRHVYEAAKPIQLAFNNPLPNAESVKLVQLCERLRWERKIFGRLLAGWVFIAPVCGALYWRPHIWITGGAGSGKTTVMRDIIGRSLDGVALQVEGETSEAGIRFALAHDARPVVFDEFESERKKSADRTEDVMAMVTRASSESDAALLKGGTDGKASSFRTRAMFAFASIGVNLKQHAARSRVTVLGLISSQESEESLAAYKETSQMIMDTLTEDYIKRLQARAVRMIPVLRQNAKVFSEAAAIALKDRRSGDQIGALLAGAYGMYSTGLITREKAVEWIESQSWDEVSEANEQRDEIMCLRHLLSYQVRVETADHGPKTRTVSELIAKLSNRGKDYEISMDEATASLTRLGILMAEHSGKWHVRIAQAHTGIKKVLENTPWAESYARTLQRIEGATRIDPRKFGFVSYRSVELPLSSVIE